ncbi:hypothetical protein WJX81_008594 [Elliptochloris bilobata]|uniref:High light inducible protein n=1 Tax=Elliptochloris bilobata TaxID=381761 RepID=A0AAW1QJ21_9CHLO
MASACQCSTSFCWAAVAPFRGQRLPAAQPARRAAVRTAHVTRADVNFPAPKAPESVTVPQRTPEVAPARFGFVDNAERINSRACMIGFFALLIVELVANKGLLELVGIRTGAGLGFEF